MPVVRYLRSLAALEKNLNFEAASRGCYLESARAAFAAKLRKYLTTGTINLRQNDIHPGETIRLTVLTARPGSNTGGLKSEFDIRVTSYGWKPVLDASLLFVRRIGVRPEEEKTDATNPNGGLRNVRFAPYPGVNFGTTFFHRSLRDCTQRDDSSKAQNKCGPSPLAEFERQRYYLQENGFANRFLHALAPGIGVNATFMTFNDLRDYDPAKGFANTKGTNFQLGAGPVVMLFNGKLSVTYGWNLMAERRQTYYGLGFNFIDAVKAIKDVFPAK